MNKLLLTSALVASSLMTLLSLSACSDDDKDNVDNKSLIGIWQMVKYVEKEDGQILESLNSTEEIENNGTYVWMTIEKSMIYLSSIISGDKDDYEEPYTYVIDGNQIIMTDADDSDSDNPYKWVRTYYFENDQLVLYSSEDDDEYGLYEEYCYYVKY